MVKDAEVLVELDTPIKREKGYFYYLSGEVKGDGIITKISRSLMPYMRKKQGK